MVVTSNVDASSGIKDLLTFCNYKRRSGFQDSEVCEIHGSVFNWLAASLKLFSFIKAMRRNSQY